MESLERKKKEKENQQKLKKLKNKSKNETGLDLANAAQKSQEFEDNYVNLSEEEGKNIKGDNSVSKDRKKYMKDLKKVLEASDVIFLINYNNNKNR